MIKDYMAPVIPGLVLAFLAIVFGTVAGMAFGLIEDDIKGHYLSEVQAHPAIHEQTPANIKKQVHDSWRYTQRAHFHAQGLGALGVGIILTLAFSSASTSVRKWLSLAVGGGALLYPFCWLIAGLRIASMGKHAAKASVDWLAYISIPMFFGGMMLTLLILILGWLFPQGWPGFLKNFQHE